MEAFVTLKRCSPPGCTLEPLQLISAQISGEELKEPELGPARSCWCLPSPVPGNAYALPSYLVSLMA